MKSLEKQFEPQNQEIEIDREQQIDFLLQILDSVENIQVLKGKKFEEVFANEKGKRNFINGLNPAEFIQLLSSLNGLLRNKSVEEWGMDGENVAVGGNIFSGLEYISPKQEDKPELLENLLVKVKEMNKNKSELKDIAMVVAASINAIHPFLDGNGRTSRFLYLALLENYNEATKEKIKNALSVSATANSTESNVNPSLVMFELNELIGNKVGVNDPRVNPDRIIGMTKSIETLEFGHDVNKEDADLFRGLHETDKEYLFWAVFEFLRDNPGIEHNNFVEKFPHRSIISSNSFVKGLKQEDLNQILMNYRALKKEYVNTLMDSLANPEKEEYQIQKNGARISLKAYFEQKTREKNEEMAKEEREYEQSLEIQRREEMKIQEKENYIKNRFDGGEGEFIIFTAEEIRSIGEVEQSLSRLIKENESQIADSEKIEVLRKTLLSLASKINGDVSVTQEQIDNYIEKNKERITDSFAKFQIVDQAIELLEKSDLFAYRINTSRDVEVPFFSQDYLNTLKDASIILDDLFSQSIYFVTPNGASLRLKLFEIQTTDFSKVFQPSMEQIFYNNRIADFTDKQVMKISDLEPAVGKYIFEISSSGFRQAIMTNLNEANQPNFKSGIGTITDETGIYVNIPEGAISHAGWRTTKIKKLK